MNTKPTLTPIVPTDHPQHHMTWTPTEIKWITAYAERAVDEAVTTLHNKWLMAQVTASAGVSKEHIQQAPIDMVLHCPACGLQHIDRPNEWSDEKAPCDPPNSEMHPDDWAECDRILKAYEAEWTNPPHRSHLCLGCKHIWRPADVPTNGVKAVTTKGENDSPIKEMKP